MINKGDVGAYEFGREMQSYTVLKSSSLDEAIQEYSDGLSINHPYEADNACVKRGFIDAKSGKESPYNKEGKSCTKF